jgi:hypothetical protein
MTAQESDQKNTSEEDDDYDISKERFSFPPGSSQKSIERNINARRRKLPPEGVFLTLTAPIALPDNYGVKIGTADQVFAERCHRKVCKTGARRKPYITLPEAWTNRMGIDYKNKANGHDDMTLEFSPDGTTITMRKTPAPKGMRQRVDARIFGIDSDAAAELAERENQEK